MNNGGWSHYPHAVVSMRPVTPVIQELWLAPAEASLPYRPGQYALLEDLDFWYPPRSYSLVNAPREDGRIALLVTRYPGGITSGWVHNELAVGDTVMVTGPYGTFVLDERFGGPVLLLGAGSGVAPVNALVESLATDQPHRPVTLAFSGRTRADQVYADRYEAWARDRSGFDYIATLTREPGAARHDRLTTLLPREIESLAGWEVFVSGPSGFVADCAALVVGLGADPARVHTEEFFADPEPLSATTAESFKG